MQLIQKAFLSKHKSSKTLLLNHTIIMRQINLLIIHSSATKENQSFHYTGTGNLALKKFANRLDKCVLVYVFL
jgi:hypothetical protein